MALNGNADLPRIDNGPARGSYRQQEGRADGELAYQLRRPTNVEESLKNLKNEAYKKFKAILQFDNLTVQKRVR